MHTIRKPLIHSIPSCSVIVTHDKFIDHVGTGHIFYLPTISWINRYGTPQTMTSSWALLNDHMGFTSTISPGESPEVARKQVIDSRPTPLVNGLFIWNSPLYGEEEQWEMLKQIFLTRTNANEVDPVNKIYRLDTRWFLPESHWAEFSDIPF